MKLTTALPMIFALSISSLAFAQSGDMKGMDMKGMKDMDMHKGMEMKGMKDMHMKKCMDMKGMGNMEMKGMDMKDMDAKHCQEMMKGTDKKHQAGAAVMHQADGVVKVVDPVSSKVTLAHGAVKTLGWPAMTMAFAVKDKALLNDLVAGKKVHVEFNKQGSDYVITSVK
jgi:Cu(I)/Ag(I) efflux system protein CusF